MAACSMSCIECGCSVPKAKKLKRHYEDTGDFASRLLGIEYELCEDLLSMTFPEPVSVVYSPLDYAAETHESFVRTYGNSKRDVLFLGMNPGPFGMAQNGVPFGDTVMVKEWLKIEGVVHKPPHEHPKRLVVGLDCKRREVSGMRFWSLFDRLCSSPEQFFKHCYVHNYCPLSFMEGSGKNVTPPTMKGDVRAQLEAACDRALSEVVLLFQPSIIVGVGQYAETRARKAVRSTSAKAVDAQLSGREAQTSSHNPEDTSVGKEIHICSIPHPSPRNAKANKDWYSAATDSLERHGVLKFIVPTVTCNSPTM